MVKTYFLLCGDRQDSVADSVVRECILRLVEGRLGTSKCPLGCSADDLIVEVRGNWPEGEFDVQVIKTCCRAHVVSANELLKCGQARARSSTGFLAAA